ncbi:MAG: hypothetical protein LBB29_00770 [Holosporaceae bacterium]|jgi:hypothetical protein|nr:hypothetical protein [Holosporaceae bacterium]
MKKEMITTMLICLATANVYGCQREYSYDDSFDSNVATPVVEKLQLQQYAEPNFMSVEEAIEQQMLLKNRSHSLPQLKGRLSFSPLDNAAQIQYSPKPPLVPKALSSVSLPKLPTSQYISMPETSRNLPNFAKYKIEVLPQSPSDIAKKLEIIGDANRSLAMSSKSEKVAEQSSDAVVNEAALTAQITDKNNTTRGSKAIFKKAKIFFVKAKGAAKKTFEKCKKLFLRGSSSASDAAE